MMKETGVSFSGPSPEQLPANAPPVSPNSQINVQPKEEQKIEQVIVSKKTYNQNWPAEQEEIFADWADIAACYRLLHDWSQKKYHKLNLGLSIPVILLTTLTGSANLSVSSVTGDDKDNQKISNLVIGGISIVAGILSTVSNFLRYAPSMEAHRIASLSWGKLQRTISVELALDRNDRKDSMDFLKVCRAEIDRLIEQSPSIPESVLKRFEQQFKEPVQKRLEGQTVITKPEICNYLEHTYIYRRPNDQLTDNDDGKSDGGFHAPPPLKDASLGRIQEYLEVARALNQEPVAASAVPVNEVDAAIAKLAQTRQQLEAQQKASTVSAAAIGATAPQNTFIKPGDSLAQSRMYYLP